MPETPAGEVIVGHFDHKFRLHRLPFRRPLCRPSARPARRISRKASILPCHLELISEGRLVLGLDARRKSHVVKQALSVIKAEQHGPDDLAARLQVLAIAETPDHTVRASMPLYLLHAVAVPGLVWQVEPFRNDTVAATACRSEPT